MTVLPWISWLYVLNYLMPDQFQILNIKFKDCQEHTAQQGSVLSLLKHCLSCETRIILAIWLPYRVSRSAAFYFISVSLCSFSILILTTYSYWSLAFCVYFTEMVLKTWNSDNWTNFVQINVATEVWIISGTAYTHQTVILLPFHSL